MNLKSVLLISNGLCNSGVHGPMRPRKRMEASLNRKIDFLESMT